MLAANGFKVHRLATLGTLGQFDQPARQTLVAVRILFGGKRLIVIHGLFRSALVGRKQRISNIEQGMSKVE
jgi:hypothetical protein